MPQEGPFGPPAFFLPGASGRRAYWQPVASRLRLPRALLLGWPGFGDELAEPQISRLSDLIPWLLDKLTEPSDLVAQSMGGTVAILAALAEPAKINRLVLCGTSGGIDMSRFDAADWREEYATAYLPSLTDAAPRWFLDDRTDVTERIPATEAETLLLWGEEDRISPVAVGRYLAGVLPHLELVVVKGAGHSLAQEQPDQVAEHIRAFLGQG